MDQRCMFEEESTEPADEDNVESKEMWRINNQSQVSEQSNLLDGDAALRWENKGEG